MQYSVRQKQPAFDNAEKGTINKTLSLVLTLFLKFSCSLSLQIPPTYTISTFSLKYESILTHNFSNVNIYLMDILIMVAFLIIVFITLYFLSVFFHPFSPFYQPLLFSEIFISGIPDVLSNLPARIAAAFSISIPFLKNTCQWLP
jgi:hypothetical protein